MNWAVLRRPNRDIYRNHDNRLIVEGAAEAEDVAVVVDNFEGAQAVAGVAKGAVDGDGLGLVFSKECVWGGSEHISVPPGPGVTGVIGLRVDLRGDVLEIEHDAVPLHHGPEIFCERVTAALVEDFKTEEVDVEVNGRLEVIDDEEGRDGV